MTKLFLIAIFLITTSVQATSILTAEGGVFKIIDEDRTEHEELAEDLHFDFTLNYYYGWDQMVLLGIGTGLQQLGTSKSFPLMTHLFIRLPIGSLFLPIAQGSWGYQFGENNSFFWRIGGGVDMKLGDRSSLILMAGSHNYLEGNHSPLMFVRAGLLLEF